MPQSRRVKHPTVALVGRTNVGKSTLFNKILEEERAIVSETHGTTRDRNYGIAFWRGIGLQFVDTGGLDIGKAEALEHDVVRQAELAMRDADIILFVADLESGPLPQDRTLGAALTKSPKKVILVANKADNPRVRSRAHDQEWQKLRLGEVSAVSAKNGAGVGDLLDRILAELAMEAKDAPEPETMIAVIGRPNVGKSSLINRLCREERLIVSPIAGTTREPQDTLLRWNDRLFLLVDTVGLRRRAKKDKLERAGVDRTERAIERAEVLLLVLDASEPITWQDRALAGLAEASGKAVILVMNKWDLVPDKTPTTLRETETRMRSELPFFRFAPIRFVSAETGARVDDLLEEARTVKARWQTVIPERQLDRFFRRMLAVDKANKGPARPYVYRMKQTGSEPPTFLLTIRGKAPAPEAFLRSVENRLRNTFDFVGTPIRVRGKNIQLQP